MDRILTQLSSSLHATGTIDQLVRPMLEMLSIITEMESTYLTSINLEQHTQNIRLARNCGDLMIPEGLTVPWEDTLCKRAMDMGRFASDMEPIPWGELEGAAKLKIQSFVSTPICSDDGMLMGTLCAASTSQRTIQPNAEALFRLFAKIVGDYIERELLLGKLQAANDQLAAFALTDELTRLPNRRAMFDELERMLALANRSRIHILVGVIDLDGFKQINDHFGHLGGDEFLKSVAQRLSASMRTADRIGRLGGDEFLFIGPGPIETGRSSANTQEESNPAHAAQHLQQRLTEATAGYYSVADKSLNYGGASVGVVAIPPDHVDVEAAIHLADTQMYRVKHERKMT